MEIQRKRVLSVLEERGLDKFENPTPTDKVELPPLPQTGRQMASFLDKSMSTADINNSNNDPNNKISRTKRKLKNLVAKIMNGDITTEKGGFVFNEHEKNAYFMKYNDLPDFDEVMK